MERRYETPLKQSPMASHQAGPHPIGQMMYQNPHGIHMMQQEYSQQ